VVEQQVCVGGTPPGSTVTFTAFEPCPDAAVGAEWFLTDTRESTNEQTYKVKKLADGHIWMVQDLKFGNLCGTTFSGSTHVQTGHVSNTGTYYGDCTVATSASTPANRGYLYDWAAAINKAGAYTGSSSNVGCSGTVTGSAGTAPGACQGICPAGWHVPTGRTSGEYNALRMAIGGCNVYDGACWNRDSAWEGVLGGDCSTMGTLRDQNKYGYYWTSSYYGESHAYALYYASNGHNADSHPHLKNTGILVRCVRNY
jgi:uncharacterized protein (TIGR02145 family)